jgi:hypothetical protein
MDELIKKPQHLAELPTFGNTLAWPREIEARMHQHETRERAGELAAAMQKAADEGDSDMLEMFESLREEIGTKGLDQATLDLVRKTEAAPGERPNRIHKLSDWLELAKIAGTLHVPYELGPVITTEELEQTHEAFHYGEPDSLPAVLKETILPWIQTQQDRGWMWRFEWCATQTIKEVLGTIRPERYLDTNRVKVPFTTDERVLHCMWDTGLEESNLLARPWIRAAFEKGFPVEFRIFRTGRTGEEAGWAACNYYVQRDLSEAWRPAMMKALELAQQFESTLETLGYLLPEQYTTDWILTAEGELLMLEAGPGFTPMGGAHPCCFNPENGPAGMAGRSLLANEPGAIFYFPPEIQEVIEQIKAGAHPLKIAEEKKLHPLQLLQIAAIQGHRPSQMASQIIQEKRFLEQEAWEKALKDA